MGYQYHNIAVREQKNASLLILPLRKEPEYRATLPGKLFEYLASMNPILGIGQTDGAMARIVNQTGAGVVFGWEDKASVTAYLDLCWKRFNAADDDEDIQVEHSGETELKEILADNDKSDAIRQFSRKALTARMADLSIPSRSNRPAYFFVERNIPPAERRISRISRMDEARAIFELTR